MLTAHATVLLVEDVRGATDYYRDRLGFAITIYEADPEPYGSAERDHCHVHFAHYDGAHPRPKTQTATSSPSINGSGWPIRSRLRRAGAASD